MGGALLLFFENGVPAAGVDLTPVVDQVHLLHSCDLVLLNRDSACRPIVVHANGKLVTSSDPADAGEQIVIYGVGLGWPSTPIPTGDTVTALSPTSIQFRIGFDARPNALASRPPLITEASGNLAMPPAFSGLTAGFVGLYQVNVVVPSLPKGATACSAGPVGRVESNMTIKVAGPASFAGVGICVRTEP